jgi:hypothetical protein
MLLSTEGRASPQPPAADANSMGRQAGDHLFLPSQIIRDPFLATFLSVTNGYGVATADGVRVDINGNTVATQSFTLAGLSSSFDLQLQLLPWWALRFGANTTVYTGAEANALVGVGAVVEFHPRGGTTVSFPIGDRVLLGGTFDIDYGRVRATAFITVISLRYYW